LSDDDDVLWTEIDNRAVNGFGAIMADQSSDVAGLLVALAALKAERARRPAAPPFVAPADVEALASALRHAVNAPAAKLPTALCNPGTTQRIEAARAALSAPSSVSRRNAAWEALAAGLAAAESDAIQAWTAVGLRDEHAVMQEANRLQGLADDVAEAAHKVAEARPHAGPRLEPGDRASIYGLGSRPELNGRRCIVRKFLASKSRYAVAFDDGTPPLLLRPSNLLLIGRPGEVGPLLSMIRWTLGILFEASPPAMSAGDLPRRRGGRRFQRRKHPREPRCVRRSGAWRWRSVCRARGDGRSQPRRVPGAGQHHLRDAGREQRRWHVGAAPPDRAACVILARCSHARGAYVA